MLPAPPSSRRPRVADRSGRASAPASEVVLAALVAFFALRAVLPSFWRPIDAFDEGLLLTDAYLLTEGFVPFRDFYTNYPPGPFLAIAAAWKLFGTSAFVARCLGLLALLTGATLAGSVAGRIAGERFAFGTFASVLALQYALHVAPFAYVLAVTLGMLTVRFVPEPTSSVRRHAAHGFLFGTVAWFRHDLFLQTAAILGLVLGLLSLSARTRALVPPKRAWWATIGGASLAVSLVYLPLLLLAGPRTVVTDLVLDQLRLLPARELPLPDTVGALEIAALELEVVGILSERVRAVLLFTACTYVGLLFTLPGRLRDAERSPSERLTLVWLVAFAVATLPYALRRVDYPHVAYAVPFLATLMHVVACRRPYLRALVPVLTLVPLLAVHAPLARADVLERIAAARTDSALLTEPERTVIEAVRAMTRPGERIFVGCSDHTRVSMSPISLHYLLRRPGATRRMQFDPILVTEDAEQRRMIAELERTRPPLVIRFAHCFWPEPNASSERGSDRLDRYLDAHYTVSVRNAGGYRVLRRPLATD